LPTGSYVTGSSRRHEPLKCRRRRRGRLVLPDGFEQDALKVVSMAIEEQLARSST
jgi:hypothetical protein